jgi:hypothetical protein
MQGSVSKYAQDGVTGPFSLRIIRLPFSFRIRSHGRRLKRQMSANQPSRNFRALASRASTDSYMPR